MPFPRRLLTEGEDVILDLRPHWIALTGPLLWTIFIGAVTGFVWVKTGGNHQGALRIAELVAALVAWIPLAAVPAMRWRYTMFVLTSERVITRTGVIAKHSKEIPLETINDVTFHVGILDRMIGAGDLIVESAGETGQDRFSHIRRPEHVQLEIYRRSEARKGLKNKGQAGGHSLADELAKLAELRDRGILTAEEFDARKRKLLET